MMRLILIIFFLFSTISVRATEEDQGLVRTDFAFGMELSISGQGAIYGMAVPVQVYRACTRADLGDLRVFNGQGLVPHILQPQVSKKTSPQPVYLPFFPLVGMGDNSQLPPELQITTDSKGTIIDIRQDRTEPPSTVVTAYIIDISGLEEKADWLEFTWIGKEDNFSTSVSIDTSDDLNGWQPLVHSAALAELQYLGHNLLRNRITMKAGMKKYLRLSWPPDETGVDLTVIKAGYTKEERIQARTVHHLVGEPKQDADKGKMSYHYSSDGFFPVDQVSIRLPQQNSMAQVTVFSRANEEEPWRQRASLLSYHLTIDGVNFDSRIKDIAPTTDRFWRLEINNLGRGSGAPTLSLGWLPQQLVFVAQGEGPYTLAYGRAGLGPERSQVDRLLTTLDPHQEKNMIMVADAGAQIILGGTGMLLPSPEVPWRRWILWASLVVGVLVIGGMAFQLFKEMKKEAM